MLEGFAVKVVEMKGRRVSKLLLTPSPEAAASHSEA